MKRETKARLTALNKKVAGRNRYEAMVKQVRADGYKVVNSSYTRTILMRAGKSIKVRFDGLVFQNGQLLYTY